jgi:hypothetical protein
MRFAASRSRLSSLVAVCALASVLVLSGCKKFRHTDTQPLYQSGLWSDTIQKLQELNVTDGEVSELIKVHQAGLSDDGCIQLIQLARSRQKVFGEGDDIAGLLSSGISEANVLELARLGQLGAWAVDMQGMKLAGYSDKIVMAEARRRAAGQATLSGSSLVELKNTGLSEPQILGLIAKGLTDEQAGELVAMHQQTEMPHGFVHGGSGKRHR